jgi:hypothetical protein
MKSKRTLYANKLNYAWHLVLKVNGPRFESVELPAQEQVGTSIININKWEWASTKADTYQLSVEDSRIKV